MSFFNKLFFRNTYKKPETNKICFYPFQQIDIGEEHTYFCCSNWCNYYDIGNIFKTDIKKIWNSKAVQEVRKKCLMVTFHIAIKKFALFFLIMTLNQHWLTIKLKIKL